MRYVINVRPLRPAVLIVLSPLKMVAVCTTLPLQKPRRKLYHENGKSGLLLQATQVWQNLSLDFKENKNLKTLIINLLVCNKDNVITNPNIPELSHVVRSNHRRLNERTLQRRQCKGQKGR